MKKATIYRSSGAITIQAPEGKEMAINDGHLAHGMLSFTEHGPSGIKIAAFNDWSEVVFDCEAHGYTITEENPF